MLGEAKIFLIRKQNLKNFALLVRRHVTFWKDMFLQILNIQILLLKQFLLKGIIDFSYAEMLFCAVFKAEVKKSVSPFFSYQNDLSRTRQC